MKVAVVLALVCLHLSSAVTPDQALQEEWKVGLQLYIGRNILHAKQTIVVWSWHHIRKNIC